MSKFVLKQNYPNPFNPNTTIEFSIPKQEYVSLKIYNSLGQEVALLLSEKLNSGNHKANLDASHLTSGIYICRLQAENGFAQYRKLVLLK